MNWELFNANTKTLYSCTLMARVYLLKGREYLENQSLNQLINQSVSDSRGTGVFKLLEVEELQKEESCSNEKVYF